MMRRLDPGVASTLWSSLKRFFSRSRSTSAPSSLTSGAPKESRARDGSETTMSNPWYEVAGPDVRLTQGDIILDCPLLKWQLDDVAEGEKASGERLFKAAKAIKADVVVMTQACDLEQGKVSDVVLCPCPPLSRYKP